MDDSQRQLFREALVDNIRHRGAKDVNQFIETLPEKERKKTLFPSSSEAQSQHAPRLLHEALKLEKFDIFTILVNYCVTYDGDITVPDSKDHSLVEFATLRARTKFLEFLENRVGLSKLVPSMDAFQRLVRLSCEIGNKDMIEHWLSKMTEWLNRTLSADDFISGIDPVTTAFKAGHHDLACNLFKRNIVKITENMYVQTGNFLAERLEEVVEQVDACADTGEQEGEQVFRAQWCGKNIWFFHASWLRTTKIQSTSLRTIDLSSNHLEHIPAELLWGLPHLQYLLLNHNDLTSLPLAPENLPKSIERFSLVKLDVSNNKLTEVPVDVFTFPEMETLDLSHNYIHRLPYDVQSDGPDVYWLRCRRLSKLDVSHNQIGTLPLWLTRCAFHLTSLNISYNKMETLLPSWKCSLQFLDASHNNISEMSVCDFHTHWAHSLSSLNLSHNEFNEIPGTVCQLTLLNILDISWNDIDHLPADNLWTTRHLSKLNLSHNKLRCNYEDSTRSSTASSTFYVDLVFPKVLNDTLKQLYLGNNQLMSVPASLCDMRELAKLDLSGNANLRKLPHAMCRLRKLYSLDLKLTSISEPPDIVPLLENTTDLLQKLRETHENFKPFHQVKVVVAGPRNSGKTTLVRSLWESEAPNDGLDTGKAIDVVNRRFKNHIGLATIQRTLTLHGESLFRDIDYNVWDLKGGDSFEMIHRCCVTPNTIYILVWDLNGDVNEIDKLLPWWLTIKSMAPGSHVILVGTHKNTTRRSHNKMIEFIDKVEGAIKTKFRPDMSVCYVDTSRGQTKYGFQRLENKLVMCVNKLKYECRGSSYGLSSLMVPETFLVLKDRIALEFARMHMSDCPRIITESDVQTYVDEIHNSCLQNEDDLHEALDFLNYTGSFIHVSDRKYGLGRLYFPDPAWLCDILTTVTDLPQSALDVSGKITKEHLKRLCQQSGFGKEKFNEFEQLLKSFEIIMPSSEDNIYWIPCKLPAEKAAMEFRHEGPEPKQLRRVYQLPYIPPGFWIRLVSRIITSVEQRKRNRAFHKPRSRTLSGGSALHRAQSMVGVYNQGGDVSNVYWQTGILVFHETGELLVEDLAATYITAFSSEKEKIGVCITVKCKLGRFSILGLVIDEIESLITNWYPDLGCSDMHRLIPCPTCEDKMNYRERSDSGRRRSDPSRIVAAHVFVVQDLGTKVCKTLDETVKCPNHEERVVLSAVIPEMFLDDLNVTILSEERFKFRQKRQYKLGSGGFGDVYQGTFDGQTVAVKCFAKPVRPRAVSVLPAAKIEADIPKVIGQTDSVILRRTKTDNLKKARNSISSIKHRFSSINVSSRVKFKGKPSSMNENVETIREPELKSGNKAENGSNNVSGEKISGSTSGSTSATATFDPEVISSFSKLRNELVVMCQLQHPCIVSLIGVSLQRLCFAMEFAPLGDLNTFLQEKHDAEMAKLPLGKHVEIQGMTTLGRRSSLKVASQIAHGVGYLHKMGITHADLKPANVLVFSEDIDNPVNVKITDYGISRNVDRSGNKGRVGTPGFRAPEIGTDLIFDKEADWFSYGRLLYQLFTGVSPSHYFQQASQIKQIDQDASKGRFAFVRYSLQTSFPLFVGLMRACWRDNPRERPRDNKILGVLRDPSILALRHVIQLDPFACSCPIISTTPAEHKIHTWTGGKLSGRRRYQLLSADHGRPYAKPELNIGLPVNCVLQVGRYNLIGTGQRIQVFECPDEANHTALRDARTFSLEAKVTSLHFQQTTFGEEHYIFAGFKNGTCTVYNADPSSPPEDWTLKCTLQLGGTRMSCSGFHPVRSGKELWVACGNTLRIINTSDVTVSPGVIVVLDADDNVSVSDAQIDDETPKEILCMTGQQNKIWCSLEGSNKVLEYSIQSREKVNVITLQSNGNGDDDSDAITALQIVKDTLWVGKSSGDIIVISIVEKLVSFLDKEETSAIAVLSLNPIPGQPRCSVSQILRGSNERVVACMHCVDEESEIRTGGRNGFLVVWESWGNEEFERFNRLQQGLE